MWAVEMAERKVAQLGLKLVVKRVGGKVVKLE